MAILTTVVTAESVGDLSTLIDSWRLYIDRQLATLTAGGEQVRKDRRYLH